MRSLIIFFVDRRRGEGGGLRLDFRSPTYCRNHFKFETGVTDVKFRSPEALVPPFESSRRDLHDGHGFSNFLFLRFLLFRMQIATFCGGVLFKGNCMARTWICEIFHFCFLGREGAVTKTFRANFGSQT